MPDTPTGVELGIPELELTTWFGFVAPKKLPPEVLKKLNASIVQVLKMPDVVASLEKRGMSAFTSSPDEFRAYVARYMQRVAAAVAAAGIPKTD